jgi:DNA-directed RNA polymerase specialized sigma subunit
LKENNNASKQHIFTRHSFDSKEARTVGVVGRAWFAELPEVPKKILAMYYYEGLHLADIGAGFNLSKTQVCQIHAEVVNALRKYMCSVWVERDRNEARPEDLL